MDIQSVINKTSSKIGTWVVFFLCTLFITGLWLPRNWGFYGNGDWDLTYTTFEVARKSILDYGQWPHYNPYLAFGSDLDANPQANWFSIFFIPILLFGSFFGYKISICIGILIGLFGMKRLLTNSGSEPVVAILLSIIFCSASFFGRHIIEAGHSNFLYFYFIPYLFYFLNKYRQTEQRQALIWPIAILFQMICGGAPFVFIVASMIFGFWIIGLSASKKLNVKQGLMMASSFVFGFGLSLWKIIPIYEFWSSFPRLVTDDSQINLLVWLHALNDSSTDSGTPHQWHEISIGIGLLIPLFVVVYRKSIPNYQIWFTIGVIALWLGLGNQPKFVNPWYVIHHFLPVFDGLRAPFRFGFILLFSLPIAFALVINKLGDKKLILIILSSIALSTTLTFNSLSRNLVESQRIDEIVLPKHDHYSLLNRGPEYPFHYLSLKENQFLISAYEPQHLSVVSDTMKNFIEGSELLEFSPNQMQILAHDSATKLAIRFSENWQINPNTQILNHHGLIGLETLPGKSYSIFYKNPASSKGFYFSLFFLVLLLLFLSPMATVKSYWN